MESPQKKAPASMDGSKKTPRPDLVRWVSAWALFTACLFAFASALTDAAVAVVNALGIVMMCCIALQAAAAVLALRLPCRRRWVRRALAYLALALTIGGHCIYAAIAHLLLVADPGDLFFGIYFAVSIVFFAAGDIISFLFLLLGGEDEE